MSKILYIENKCIGTVHYYIEELLNKKIYTKHYYYGINILNSEFENIKPFLKNTNKKLYDDIEKRAKEINLNDLYEMNNNIQYLFYIIKGYQITAQRLYAPAPPAKEAHSGDHSKQTSYIEVKNLVKKFLITITQYKRNALLKKKLIRRIYIDNYTNKKFYKNILNYIISFV